MNNKTTSIKNKKPKLSEAQLKLKQRIKEHTGYPESMYTPEYLNLIEKFGENYFKFDYTYPFYRGENENTPSPELLELCKYIEDTFQDPKSLCRQAAIDAHNDILLWTILSSASINIAYFLPNKNLEFEVISGFAATHLIKILPLFGPNHLPRFTQKIKDITMIEVYSKTVPLQQSIDTLMTKQTNKMTPSQTSEHYQTIFEDINKIGELYHAIKQNSPLLIFNNYAFNRLFLVYVALWKNRPDLSDSIEKTSEKPFIKTHNRLLSILGINKPITKISEINESLKNLIIYYLPHYQEHFENMSKGIPYGMIDEEYNQLKFIDASSGFSHFFHAAFEFEMEKLILGWLETISTPQIQRSLFRIAIQTAYELGQKKAQILLSERYLEKYPNLKDDSILTITVLASVHKWHTTHPEILANLKFAVSDAQTNGLPSFTLNRKSISYYVSALSILLHHNIENNKILEAQESAARLLRIFEAPKEESEKMLVDWDSLLNGTGNLLYWTTTISWAENSLEPNEFEQNLPQYLTNLKKLKKHPSFQTCLKSPEFSAHLNKMLPAIIPSDCQKSSELYEIAKTFIPEHIDYQSFLLAKIEPLFNSKQSTSPSDINSIKSIIADMIEYNPKSNLEKTIFLTTLTKILSLLDDAPKSQIPVAIKREIQALTSQLKNYSTQLDSPISIEIKKVIDRAIPSSQLTTGINGSKKRRKKQTKTKQSKKINPTKIFQEVESKTRIYAYTDRIPSSLLEITRLANHFLASPQESLTIPQLITNVAGKQEYTETKVREATNFFKAKSELVHFIDDTEDLEFFQQLFITENKPIKDAIQSTICSYYAKKGPLTKQTIKHLLNLLEKNPNKLDSFVETIKIISEIPKKIRNTIEFKNDKKRTPYSQLNNIQINVLIYDILTIIFMPSKTKTEILKNLSINAWTKITSRSKSKNPIPTNEYYKVITKLASTNKLSIEKAANLTTPKFREVMTRISQPNKLRLPKTIYTKSPEYNALNIIDKNINHSYVRKAYEAQRTAQMNQISRALGQIPTLLGKDFTNTVIEKLIDNEVKLEEITAVPQNGDTETHPLSKEIQRLAPAFPAWLVKEWLQKLESGQKFESRFDQMALNSDNVHEFLAELLTFQAGNLTLLFGKQLVKKSYEQILKENTPLTILHERAQFKILDSYYKEDEVIINFLIEHNLVYKFFKNLEPSMNNPDRRIYRTIVEQLPNTTYFTTKDLKKIWNETRELTGTDKIAAFMILISGYLKSINYIVNTNLKHSIEPNKIAKLVIQKILHQKTNPFVKPIQNPSNKINKKRTQNLWAAIDNTPDKIEEFLTELMMTEEIERLIEEAS